MATVTVLNVVGSGKNKKDGEPRKPPAGHKDWLDFWVKSRGEDAALPLWCAAGPCFNAPTDGAHVRIKDETQKEYIAPFCHECNTAPEGTEFPVNDYYLVSVTDS